MTRVRVSALAQADLRRLLATSQELWGDEGAARYAATLTAAIEMIAAAPNGPNTRHRSELGRDLRCLHARRVRGEHGVAAPVHIVYYRIMENVVEIVRILHERMDPSRHLGPVRARSARPRRSKA